MANEKVQFGPFSSCVHPAFWSQFSKLKLENLGLDEKPVPILGSYVFQGPKGLPASLSVEWNAFKDDIEADLHLGSCLAKGKVLNLNTLDAFKQCDKKQILEKEGEELWNDITSGKASESPENLTRFLVLMFADLKNYAYYYWFAFPSVQLPFELKMVCEPKTLSESDCAQIMEKYSEWKSQTNKQSSGYFGLKMSEDGKVGEILSLKQSLEDDDAVLCFADAWSQTNHPGWPLKNLIALLANKNPQRLEKGCRFMSLRGEKAKNSFILTISSKGEVKMNGKLCCTLSFDKYSN